MNIFIINPKAGNKKGVELIPSLMNLDDTLIHVTKNKGEAITFLQEITKKYPNSIVYSVGGDGTLNEVVNGIYGSNSKLHVVPFGSGNDYYRVIKNINEQEVDVGAVNKRKFINIASLGVDADIVNQVNQDKNSFLKYPRNIIKTLLKYEKEELTINNKEELINILAICKGKYYGNGVPINPYYTLDDGMFNCFKATDLTNLQMIKCFLEIFKGKHMDNKQVELTNISNLKVSSKFPIICQADGEVFKDTNFTFEVMPRKLIVTNQIPDKIKRMIYR